ncbi:DUF6320 domain-containing protein [Luoshenia tenuis]|jgi:hypothetical protein|uniref:DUF6320 domain-containing protein n=1 Tax=Luoshenia tenuis TaxID=2763654 RepID=UPI003D9031A2
MLYCKSCRVSVAGNRRYCPLCGGGLTGDGEEHTDYPILPQDQSHSKRLIQIISGVALTAAIICAAINLLVPAKIWWSLFATLGLGCGWLWAVVGIVKKAKLLNNIVWQLVLISAAALLWDGLTGWRGWSLDYVFPCVCTGAMLAVIILSRVRHMPDRDYIISLILCAVMGVIPLIFMFTGVLSVAIPSVICAAASLIVILLQMIFNWKAMYREIHKKLHL